MKPSVQPSAALWSQTKKHQNHNGPARKGGRALAGGLLGVAGVPSRLLRALGVLLALGATSLLAQTTWNYTGGNVNFDWEDTSKWALGSFPDEVGAIVTINQNSAGTKNAKINSPHTVASLSAGRGGANNTRMWIFSIPGTLTLDNTGFTGRPYVGQNSSYGYQEYPIVFAGSQGVRFGGGGPMVVSGNNTFTGDVEINRSTVKIGHVNALPHGSRTGNITFNNIGSSSYGTLDLNGRSITINGLSSPVVGAGTITTASGNPVLTVGDNDQGGDFSGIINDGGGTVALTKIGTGTLILGGVNSYTGPTVIKGGTLKLSGDGTIASSGSLSITDGGAFDVTGITTPPYAINAGQSLNGGSSTGIIQGDINLSIGALLGLTHSKGTPSLNVASGTLGLNGNDVTVNVTGGVPLLNGSYKLISKSGGGSVAGTTGTVTVGGLGIAGGGTPQLSITGSELVLDVTGGAPGVEWGSGDGAWADNVAGWESGGASVYTNGNVALFTDTYSTGNPVVTLNTEVLPDSVYISSSNNYTISGTGAIGGVAKLVKLGSGALTLDVANTFSGGVALYDGTLNLKNANALGSASGTFSINGGAFDNTSGGPLTLPNHPQTWGSSLNFGGSSDLNLGAGPVTMTAGCTFTVPGSAKLTVGGDISGSGFGFVKNGTGILELDGNNTWTASSTLNLGEVIIGNDGALNGSAGLSLVFPTDTNSKILSLNGHSITIRSLLMAAIAGGTATVIRNNHASTPAILTVNPNAAATYAGTIEDGSAAPLSLIKDGTQNWTFGGGGVGAGTYSGDTTILAGTLTAGANNILPYGPGKGNLTVESGATFDILDRSAMALNGLSGAGTVNRSNPGGSANSTLTLGNNDANGNFSGRIRTTGSGAALNLVKTGTGTQILAGANDYTGTTTISGGILQIGEGGASGSLTSATIQNDSVLVFNRDGNMTYSGSIAGSGPVTNSGPGIVTLAGANSYTGPTIVSGGTLRINGSLAVESEVTVKSGATLGGTGTIFGPITVEGTLAPGASVGTLTVNNTVTLQGTTVMEVSRDGGAPTSDLLTGVTTLNYGGALVVTNIGAVSLRSGDSFNLFAAATINAGFTSVALPPLLPGLAWSTNLNADGSISINGAVIPPQFSTPAVSGSTLTLGGTGGVALGTYYVLTSDDLTLPVENWTPLATNVFDVNGNFSFQDTFDPELPQRYYMIAIP